MNKDSHQMEAEKTLKFFRNLFFALLAVFGGAGLLLGFSGRISVESAEVSGFGAVQASVATPISGVTDTAANKPDSNEVKKAVKEIVAEATRISSNEHDDMDDTLFSEVSPEKLAKMAMQEIFRKHRQAAIHCVLQDRKLWGTVLEEVEISNAVRCGIDAIPEIQDLYGSIIADSCLFKGIDPDLGVAIVSIESQGHRRAKSNKGALGLMQVKLSSAQTICRQIGVPVPTKQEQLLDPAFNISMGTWHFALSMQRFNDPVKSLVAYEAGDGGVEWQRKRYGSYEKVAYYRKVFGVYSYLKEQKGEPIAEGMKPVPSVVLAGI